jgi:CheY-like chemotaxis protein
VLGCFIAHSISVVATVLLADDDQDDVFIIPRAFEQAGIAERLVAVADGEEVLKYLKGEPPFANRLEFPFPHILVLDLKMPRMGGLDVLAWLQGRPEGKILPVIVLTESVYAPDIRDAYRLGAKTFINKPVDLRELRVALQLAAGFCTGGQPVPKSPPFMPPPDLPNDPANPASPNQG